MNHGDLPVSPETTHYTGPRLSVCCKGSGQYPSPAVRDYFLQASIVRFVRKI